MRDWDPEKHQTHPLSQPGSLEQIFWDGGIRRSKWFLKTLWLKVINPNTAHAVWLMKTWRAEKNTLTPRCSLIQTALFKSFSWYFDFPIIFLSVNIIQDDQPIAFLAFGQIVFACGARYSLPGCCPWKTSGVVSMMTPASGWSSWMCWVWAVNPFCSWALQPLYTAEMCWTWFWGSCRPSRVFGLSCHTTHRPCCWIKLCNNKALMVTAETYPARMFQQICRLHGAFSRDSMFLMKSFAWLG